MSVFKMGDKVRMINPDPKYGIGYIKVGDIGKISGQGKIKWFVDFPKQKNWGADSDDIELVVDVIAKAVSDITEAKASIDERFEKLKTKKEGVSEMASTSIVDRAKDAGKKVVAAQSAMAKTAATLEAARIFNNQLAKVAAKKLPAMVRGYADTPVGRAVIANLILVGIETTLPGMGEQDIRKQVARAAVVESYGVLMQSFKLEDMLNELFELPALKGLTEKIGLSEED